MKQLTYSIDIAKPLPEVYDLARQVERQPEIIPDYLSCRVIERQAGRWLLERTAKIHGKVNHWLSWVNFHENKGLHFTHVGGRLDGMKVNWLFTAKDERSTRMTITQTFHIRHPLPGVGVIMERWIFGPKLKNIAERVVRNFKKACETNQGGP